jgi:predicted metal-dependent peptidase
MDLTQKAISDSLLRLQMKSPFFATLALFASFIPSRQLATAATDGKDIYYNPDFLISLSSKQQDALILHEVLHAALLHVPRRGVRDAELWNIAADISINGMIAQQSGFELPEGGLRDPKLEHLSVEEIYELLLMDSGNVPQLSNPDLLNSPPDDVSNNSDEKDLGEDSNLDSNKYSPQDNSESKLNSSSNQEKKSQGNSSDSSSNQSQNQKDSLSQQKKAALESHWENAWQQAVTISHQVNPGTLPIGVEREIGIINSTQLDWKTFLWRYLVQTPADFKNFDRRFIGRGLYLEALDGESVHVFVALDTSGSINNQHMAMFLSELQGIVNAYPHIKCEVYYADTEAYGPYELNSGNELPQPKGGGGTSFVPFFEKVATSWDGIGTALCVYLTDGYGNFPGETPELPVLWVVTPGGLESHKFPFGEVVRLLSV